MCEVSDGGQPADAGPGRPGSEVWALGRTAKHEAEPSATAIPGVVGERIPNLLSHFPESWGNFFLL